MLKHISSPEDVKALPAHRLDDLAQAHWTRSSRSATAVTCVARHGRLCIALHRVFQSPHDAWSWTWDTGPHKLMTSRRTSPGLRKRRGRRASEPGRIELTTGAGHASTSISAARHP